MRALIVEDGWQRGSLAATRALARAGWTVGIGAPRQGFAAASRFADAWHEVPPPEEDEGAFVAAVRAAVDVGGYERATGRSSLCLRGVPSWARPFRTLRTRTSSVPSTRSLWPRLQSVSG